MTKLSKILESFRTHYTMEAEEDYLDIELDIKLLEKFSEQNIRWVNRELTEQKEILQEIIDSPQPLRILSVDYKHFVKSPELFNLICNTIEKSNIKYLVLVSNPLKDSLNKAMSEQQVQAISKAAINNQGLKCVNVTYPSKGDDLEELISCLEGKVPVSAMKQPSLLELIYKIGDGDGNEYGSDDDFHEEMHPSQFTLRYRQITQMTKAQVAFNDKIALKSNDGGPETFIPPIDNSEDEQKAPLVGDIIPDPTE